MGVSLSKEESRKKIDLRKEEVKKVCLSKPSLSKHQARVAFVIDDSGSMSHLYNDGTVQAIMERIFPIALQFDDNGEMEFWTFSNRFKRYENVTMENYYGYIDDNVSHEYGGTNYAPVLKDVYSKYMVEDTAKLPNYVIFITDGDNSDKSETTRVMQAMSKYPIFVQFIGIGRDKFSFLEKLDDLDDRYVDNANYFSMKDATEDSDEDLYNKLLAEYPSWVELEEVKQMLSEVPSGPKDIMQVEIVKKKKVLFGIFKKG